MPAPNMATIKIDRDSLAKLRMLADREKRSQPDQLAVLIDAVFRANPAELAGREFLGGVMDSLAESAEAGIAAETAVRHAKEFSAAGRISWARKTARSSAYWPTAPAATLMATFWANGDLPGHSLSLRPWPIVTAGRIRDGR